MREFAQYARNLTVTVAEVDLKGSPDGNYVFEAIHSHLGDILHRAPLAAGPSRLIRMVDDLKSASRPLLLVLDTWEKSTDDTRTWMEKHLLPQLSHMPGVVVMIAGQDVPDPGLNPAWRSHAVHRPLGPIGVDHWWEYSVRMWPKGGPSRDHVEALTIAAKGSPANRELSLRLVDTVTFNTFAFIDG